jgi:hypothetical protein
MINEINSTFDGLNCDQKNIIQTFTGNALPNQRWIIVKARPGCGKSYVIQHLSEKLKQRYDMKIKVHILAPTNLSANNVGGCTIHHFLGNGSDMIRFIEKLDHMKKLNKCWLSEHHEMIIDRIVEFAKENGVSEYFTPANPIVEKTPLVLIFDESSMISLPVFFCLMTLLRFSTNKWICFFGDENQLKPISKVKGTVYDFVRLQPQIDVLTFELVQNMRQANNSEFDKYIQTLCKKNFNMESKQNLKFGGNISDFQQLPYPKLVLCGTRIAVERFNSEAIANIRGEEQLFTAEVRNVETLQYSNNELFNLSVLPRKLMVKKGCQVICVKTDNNNNKTFFTNDIFSVDGWTYNTNLASCEIVLKGLGGQLIKVTPYRDEIYKYDMEGHENKIGEILQFPLQLFYAATIHRLQGCTLHNPTLIKFKTLWDKTLIYVAVSRLTMPELLYFDDT